MCRVPVQAYRKSAEKDPHFRAEETDPGWGRGLGKVTEAADDRSKTRGEIGCPAQSPTITPASFLSPQHFISEI
jgi:hypothetical protein